MEDFSVKFPRHFRPCEMPKHWKEVNRPWSEMHAPAEYRRAHVQLARTKENRHLHSHFVKGNLEVYEPLLIAKRDADWCWF